MPWRCSRVGQPRAPRPASPRGVSARRQQRVHAARASMCCASAPGYSPAIVATTWRGRSVDELRAQRDRAAREVAAEPAPRGARSRPASRSGRDAQLLQERAAQVLLDLLARLLDGDLGQAGHRGEVQELERLGVGARRAAARAPIVSSPEAIGTSAADARRHRRGAAARALADVAAQRADVGRGARRQRRRRPAAGPRSRPAPPAASAASSATRPSPSPPSTASTIRRWTARSRCDERRRAAARRVPLDRVRLARRPAQPQRVRLRREVRVGLQRLLTGLAGADPVGLLDRHDEHLAVADRARPRVLEDRCRPPSARRRVATTHSSLTFGRR